MPIKSIQIDLGGRSRSLRYDFNALCALESEMAISLADLGTILTGSVKLTDLRAIVWAGLKHEDKALTPEATGELLDISKIAEVADKVREAFEASFPAEDETAKNAKGSAPKKNGTSKSS